MSREAALRVVATPTKRKKRDDRVGLMNPAFVYIKAAETDVRATFERIRQQMAKGK